MSIIKNEITKWYLYFRLQAKKIRNHKLTNEQIEAGKRRERVYNCSFLMNFISA